MFVYRAKVSGIFYKQEGSNCTFIPAALLIHSNAISDKEGEG
jgi:hypothetical protein